MKTIILAGAALAALAAVPASAQPPEGGARFAAPQTRAEIAARVQARFERADADRDGSVTQDELRARAEARRGERQERRGERRERLFDRLDSDHDGAISRAEFDARPAMGGGERRGRRLAHRGGRPGMMAGFGERAFAAMDLDHDGRVALAEANRAALERFDRLDSDRDGTISPDERQSARDAFRERMQDRQGED